MKHAILIIVWILASFNVQAMKVEVHGTTVYASGPVEDDYGKFLDAFSKPTVDTVVFVNSPGGDLNTGMKIGRLIADKGFKTVTAGTCISSCAIMFMGGKDRTFSDAFRPVLTYIGIHGAHNLDTKQVNAMLQPQIYAFFKQQMAGRFNADVINKALYDMDDHLAMLKVFGVNGSPKLVPYHFRSEQTLRRDCTEFKDLDALQLGVVTSADLTKIELPESYKLIPQVFGHELNRALQDANVYFEHLDAVQCSSDRCRKLIADYLAAGGDKALALPVDGKGLGTSSKRDTPENAFVGALFNCNHIKDKPARLCETKTVDGYDVSDFYVSAEASHKEALEKLTPPPNKFYANEEYGGGLTSAKVLRTQNYHDITPQKLDGIKTYGTQELAAALKSTQPPVVVDVLGGGSSIPSAVVLLYGGLAETDELAEKAYEQRFSELLRLLSPDMSHPIVFYCLGRNCWLSVNASLRAKKLGYTQVGWYRGGTDSWKAANLPFASAVVRAVVK
jgi:PQQ-dependent catabolism-associated CXXCW motif protein